MRIALVGGSGFIGTRLAKMLIEKGLDFIIIDKNKSKTFPGKWLSADVRNIVSLRLTLKGCDCIVNLAAEHRDDVTPVSLYDEVNVNGAQNICEVADELGIKKIIFTSSVAVYGFTEKETDESGSINYFNDYGRTKLLAEEKFKTWYRQGNGKSLAIIRPTVVFGEGNRGNVYNLFHQIISGRFFMIGNGRNKKSMIYVENIAALLMKALELEGYFLTNAVDKPDLTMNELVRLVNQCTKKEETIGIRIPQPVGMLGGYAFDLLSKMTGKKFNVSSVRIKKFCSSTQFASKNMGKINFESPVSLEEGLKRTLTFEFGKSNQ